MLTKVSTPNHLASSNIIKFYIEHNEIINNIDRIQDNMDGNLLIKYKNSKKQIYNYHMNKFYTHDKIQIIFNGFRIIKQIDSFDQNNYMIGNCLRMWVFNRINQINKYEFDINTFLGIGGEYYLYWMGLNKVKMLIGISNHLSIIDDAKLNIPWSINYLVNYNNLKTYPNIKQIDLIIINLFQININVIKYLKEIKFKKIILISCNLPDNKLKLLSSNFKLISIKYFNNFENFLRVIEIIKL